VLFPFVSNSAGFDTRLSVTNTSTGGSGRCVLEFAALQGFEGRTPAELMMKSIAAGATQSINVSAVAPGFQGCAMAHCLFPSARGQYRVSPAAGGSELLSGPGLDPGNISKQVIDELSTKTQGLAAKCLYLAPGAEPH
jgi:hypothetical protein